MYRQKSFVGLWMAISFLLAGSLSLFPLPIWIKPDWVSLTVLAWLWFVPQRFSIVGVWIFGLFLDVLYGSRLGQQASALLVMSYVALFVRQRIASLPWWQDSVLIVAWLALRHLVYGLLNLALGLSWRPLTMLYPMVTTLIYWPLLRMICWPRMQTVM